MRTIDLFYYGGSYYPLIEKEADWLKDLRLMKEAGINFIRTAEIVNSWDRLEPANGDFEFDILDRFFDLCAKEGMKILLGTGSATPPYWVHKEDPTVNIKSHMGNRFPNNTVYGWACYNNPTYQKYFTRYLKTLVNHYKDHEALLGYQINNEIGYPFMPLNDRGLEYYCYCDHCKAEYREWAKDKYGGLDALTEAYSWSATTTVHQDWDDLEPPYTKPVSWSSVTRFLDWRLFHMDVITNQVKREYAMIKALDDAHPVITNVFFMKSQDKLGVITGLDQFSIAKHVDIIGYDLYPGSGDKLEYKPEFSSMFFDHQKSVAALHNKPHWLSEAEAGPIGGWVLGPDRKTDATDILRNQLEAIGHGNTSVLYQLFKEPRFQPLHWGGMITTDSRKTPQFESAKSIGELVSKHKDFLLESTVAPAKVAIYIAKENHVIMHGLNHEPFFLEELRGVYRYYWSKNHTIDFITDSHFEKGLVSRYEVIHFPLVATIKPAMTKHLEKYVENGGHAVMSARFGYMDAHGWYQHRMPGNNLHSVFGFEVTACEKEEAPTIVLKNGERVPGYHHKETLALSDHCETLATFEDGTPAVMESGLKKGTVLYFATHPGQAHLKEGHSLMDSIMTPYLEKCGVSPSVTIAGHEDWATRIDPHVLLRDHEKWLILTHYVPKESKPLMHEKTTITVTLDEPVIELRNVLLNTAHPFKVRGGKTHFDVVVNDETFPVLAYRTAGSDRNA